MFLNARDAINAGRWRRKRLRPYHHHVLMLKALTRLHLKYREYVLYYNKYDQLQYLDIVIKRNKGLAVILWLSKKYYSGTMGRRRGLKDYEKKNRERKIEHLQDKGIPFIWMDREHSSEEFMIIVNKWIKSLDKNKP